MVLHRPVELAPFIRTWPRREMLSQTTLDSLLSRRNFLLQFFKPVQHYVDLRRRCLFLLAGLEHQEALAVGRHVVVRDCSWRLQVLSLKERLRLARGETR